MVHKVKTKWDKGNITMAAIVAERPKMSSNIQEILDGKIAELVDEVRESQQQLNALGDRVTAAKEQLRELLEMRGSNWSDDVGYARLSSDSSRKYYDSRALDELILADPLQYGWLKDFRKEAAVRGSVQIK
jgi:seryl-tRNA synthetase